MRRRLLLAFAHAAFLLAAAPPAIAAEGAMALVDDMRDARDSEGFEIRMDVETTRADGAAAQRIKLALIGDANARRRRLLARAIAPARLRAGAVVAEAVDGRIDASTWPADAPAATRVDPSAPLFDTALIPWDLLTPWWDWPDQALGARETIAGHACVEIRSRAPASDTGPVREVRSCIDAGQGLAWRTRLLDRRGRELRSIEVARAMRTQAGRSVAKSAVISAADGSVTRLEVYAGDERYRVGPETFSGASSP